MASSSPCAAQRPFPLTPAHPQHGLVTGREGGVQPLKSPQPVLAPRAACPAGTVSSS